MTPALFLALGLLAQVTPAAVPSPPATTSESAPAAPVLREVAPGVVDYHGVRLDKKNGRVSFDATVNQVTGLVEYLLVNEKGKVHESLFATKVMPHDIHLGLLLIGLKEDPKPNVSEPLPPSAIDSAYLHAAPKIKGAPVRIMVTWTQDGKKQRVPAENWIFNLHTRQLMAPGPWTYNGSLVEDGAFVADQELSIVSVITDPTALVNNPREGYDDDEIWQIQDKAVPPMDTPVEITIALADVSPPAAKP
jgi:hypothetical protein